MAKTKILPFEQKNQLNAVATRILIDHHFTRALLSGGSDRREALGEMVLSPKVVDMIMNIKAAYHYRDLLHKINSLIEPEV